MILTTHSMDEAELLCTRLGVMVQGRIRAIGTSNHLKEKFGQGYMLLLNFEESRRPSVLAFLSRRFRLREGGAAEVVKDFPGQLIIRITTTSSSSLAAIAASSSSFGGGAEGPQRFKMSSIFSVMVNEAQHCGVSDWAVSQVGLNEVFQSVMDKWARKGVAQARGATHREPSAAEEDTVGRDLVTPSGAVSRSSSSN